MHPVNWSLLILLMSGLSARASDLGTTGLIDLPTARVMDDGEFRIVFSQQRLADIYNLNYQATPWLEVTYRYVRNDVKGIRYADARVGQHRDRSYAFKVRLLEESAYLPQIAVGAQDFFGSGAWAGEYAVASKQFRNFDVSLGLGWGRFAKTNTINNPLKLLSDRFGSGYSPNVGGDLGGQARFGSLFRGDRAGIFGGVSYQIPGWPLRVLAEYSSDNYSHEQRVIMNDAGGASPFNFALDWKPSANTNLVFSRQQGNQWGLRLALSFDTKSNLPRNPPPRFYSSTESRDRSQAPENLNLASWYDRLLYDIERSGLLLRRADLPPGSSVATLEISNMVYGLTADAIHRALTLAEAHLPPSVVTIILVLNEDNIRPATIVYRRQNRGQTRISANNARRIDILPSRVLDSPTNTTIYRWPEMAIGVALKGRVQFFDPEVPLRHQLAAVVSVGAKISEGWNLWGSYFHDITNNFSTNRPPASSLPHVRSEINRYLVYGATGLDALYLEKRGTFRENWHYRAYAGVLEEMYSGAGGEIIFQPFQSRFAFGASLNAVRRRDYDRGWDLLDWKVVTGHVSAYWASPFHNLDLGVHAGRYLAKDVGTTFEVRRTFDNGWMIGGFATFTNVSAAQFGEGSFDKGFFFRVPLDKLLPGNQKNLWNTTLHNLQRDGGQRLEGFGQTLWYELRGMRYDALYNHRNRMVP